LAQKRGFRSAISFPRRELPAEDLKCRGGFEEQIHLTKKMQGDGVIALQESGNQGNSFGMNYPMCLRVSDYGFFNDRFFRGCFYR